MCRRLVEAGELHPRRLPALLSPARYVGGGAVALQNALALPDFGEAPPTQRE